MLAKFKSYVREQYTAFKESPIQSFTVSMKDKEQNVKWLQERRRFNLDRAKRYAIFLVFLCALTPIIALWRVPTCLFVEALFVASLVPTLGCIILAENGCIAVVDYMLPIIFTVRGTVSVVTQTLYFKQLVGNDGCLHVSMDLALRNLLLMCTFAETIMFLPNFLQFIFVSNPLHSIPSFYMRRLLNNAKLEICPVNKSETFVTYLSLGVMLVPLTYALFEMTNAHIKLFSSIENLRKQQAIVLEIFEKQNEATMVFQSSEALGNQHDEKSLVKSMEQTVLYSNKAFQEIFETQGQDAFDAEVIKVSSHGGNQNKSEVKNEKVYSIKDIISEPSEFVSKNIFKVTKKRKGPNTSDLSSFFQPKPSEK